MKATYLGPKGTFTESAARAMFPEIEENDWLAMQPIRNVIMSVEREEADIGIIPIENFYKGEVRETLDSLVECSKAQIIQEKALTIVHCIGALPNHQKITRILSKDQALDQCSIYLCQNYPHASTSATPSTAEAVNIIQREKMLCAAAIAPEKAFLNSGLEIMAKDICPNNKTRFIAIGINTPPQTGDDKMFLAIHPQADKPGILAGIANAFALYGINLEYFQSRPDGKKGYTFYVELDGHQKDSNIVRAIDAVSYFLDPENKFPNTVKILGSYKNSRWKNDN